MCASRASASTSSGCAYSRSIRSRTRRSRARSLRCCAPAGALVSCEWCHGSQCLATDIRREVLAGEGGAGGDEVGGGAFKDDPATVVAGAGAGGHHPVGGPHGPLGVLDDDDRLAGVREPVEQAEQLLDVGEVEADG